MNCVSVSKEMCSYRSVFFVAAIAVSLLAGSCQKDIDVKETTLSTQQSSDASLNGIIGINVLLKTPATDNMLKELSSYGTILNSLPAIKALTMKASSGNLAAIKKLSYVSDANADAVRTGAPIDAVAVPDFSNGVSTWNLDAINVTNFGQGRTISKDGTGVFIGVLDSGLPDSWRQYFPQERIATQYAKSFGGGGGENGNVSEQPNKWEHDQDSHGGHVTSTILGFQLGAAYTNGVAPKATVIPVKVLNQTGRGWSSVVARGIMYMAELKTGPLQNSPVIINMSLGGSQLDAIEKAAIDYAISKGVIIVASAGNNGDEGMGYPGAYAPVISVASAGWIAQWTSANWWTSNFPDPTTPADLFISDFSARHKAGQDLDVAAPGENIVGPYQTNSGQLSYYYLSGTSMASPHVAGIVALMAQQKPSLTAAQAEAALEAAATAVPLGVGSRAAVPVGDGTVTTISWPATASGNGFVTATAALNALP
ncbi:MAG: S8 family serine peptidase [Chitinophagaceae bacterium]|nr:S8 family serine peptidase [Chitinophagaceae bacterium]